MTAHLGMIRPGSTIYIPFDTYAGATGASVTLTGLAVTDIEVYKNGSVTQRASDTGYTLLDTDGIDFDGITGIHGFSIDLSSNATADFFTAGGFYWVVVSAVTIDSQTVNFTAATFQIGYADAVLNTTIATLASQTSFTLTTGPAEDDALNGCVLWIHDIASAVQIGKAIVSDYTGSTRTVTLVAGVTFTAAAGDNVSVFQPAVQPTVWGRTLDVSSTGEAGIDWANIGSPTTAQNLSATNIDVDQVVASVSGAVGSVTGAVGSVTGNVGGNVTGSVGSVATNGISAASLAADASAEIADAVWDEDATGHQTQGTFGQAIGDPVADADTIWGLVNTNLNATVSSRASQTSLDTLDDFVDTEIAAIITTLGTPAGASISADIAVIESQTDDIGVAGAGLTALGDTRLANLDATVSSRLATAGYTTPPTAAQNADAVWDETLADHLGAGSTGEALNAAGAAGDPWTTALPGAYGAGSAGNIIGNNLDAAISTRASQASLDTVDNLVDDLESRIGTPSNLGSGATVAANLVDIEAQTDDIGVAGAGLTALGDTRIANLDATVSSRATPAQVNTEVDTALADVGLTTTITGRIDVATSTRLASASYTAPDNATVSTINTKIGTPAGVSVSADIAAIEAQTDDIGTAGAGLTAIPWNATWDAEVQSEVADALTAYGASTFAGGAVASVTGNVGGNVAGSVGSVTSPVTVGTNNDKTGYALTAGERTSIADALLTRDLSVVAGAASRSLLNALRAIRNRVAVAAGVMTVYQEDDSTTAWTAAVTTDASADPVTQIDPS